MTIAEIIMQVIGTGQDNAVSLADLMLITGLRNRELRLLIADMRVRGSVICANSNGYFKPSTPDELKIWIRQEKARSRSINRGLRSAEKLLQDWRIFDDE